MKKRPIRIAFALFLSVVLSEPVFGTGNDNPTGVTGQYNGSVTTAGSYDPYTGNATRTITDLTVTGAVGAYPLKWSRTLNTRSLTLARAMGKGGWTHSYDWHIYLRTSTNPPHWNDETPDYHEGPDAIVYYPDGRQVWFEGGPGSDYVGAPEQDTSVLLKHVDGGNYDLYLPDGGIVQFELSSFLNGTITQTGLLAKRIKDPYGVTTTLHRDTAGRLWRIQEQAGRYLEITYTNQLITRVQAFATEGNLVETVSYVYAYLSAYLTQVNYDDGARAYYTYQGSNHPTTNAALIRTCDDVRYAGPMGRIEYVFMPAGPGVDFGQIKGEKYPGMGTLLSQVSYPAYNCCAWNDPAGFVRTETRADGAARTFQYGIGGGELTGYSDFKNQWSYTTRRVEPGNPFALRINTDARTNPTTIEKTFHGKTNRLFHPDGTSQAFVYEEVNGYPYYLLIHGDELGRNTFYERDSLHRVKKIWYGFDPNNHLAYPTEEFTYNSFGQVETHKLKSGGTENFRYDGRGLKSLSWPPATPSDPSPEVHPTRYFYYTTGPSADRLRQTIDPRGNSTWFEYNVRGQVTKVTHHDLTYTQSGYNPDGTLAWTADENHPNASWNVHERTRYVYDEYKRVLSVTNPMGETTTNSYAPWNGAGSLSHTTGSVYRTTSPMGKKTDFDYDENFRRKMVRKGAQSVDDDGGTYYEYDAVGNLSKITDPRANSTKFEYDKRNRQILVTNALNQETSTGYDAINNKTKETRPDGTFRSWKYDMWNQLWKAEDWRTNEIANPNQTTTYLRDHAGNAISITDAKGATYSFGYDVLSRKTGEIYPVDAAGVSRSETWYYDVAGNLYRHDNPAGQVQIFLHDSRNRRTDSYWWGYVGQHIKTTYDPASRVIDITTRRAEVFETSVKFGYNDANRKIFEEQTVAGFPMRRVETPSDADGNRSGLAVPGWYSVFYDYTHRNQLAHVYDGNWSPWFTYNYDVAGNLLKRQAVYGGVNDSVNVHPWNYDPLNRPVEWEKSKAGDVTYARSWYKYDNVGRKVATWRDEDWPGRGERFEYEHNDQLKKVWYDAQDVWTGTPTNETRKEEFNYSADKLNRSSVTTNGVASSYVMLNGMNQYTAVGGQTVEYDNNFNIKSYGGLTFTFDAANRLTGGAMQGVYDGLGRCVKRTINGVTKVVTYDGWKPIMEWDGAGNFHAWNVYGPGADEILWRAQTGVGHLRYHSDIHGSVTALLDWSGNILEKYVYDAFGKPTVTDWLGIRHVDAHDRPQSWYGNRFMFTGREWLPELGIYDYRNRMYHPGLGRFLQTDPIGFDAGDMNLFRYCGGDPVNRTDPFGLVDDYMQLSPREERLLEIARANVDKPEMRLVEVSPRTFRKKPMTRSQAVIARGNARKLSGISVGTLEKRGDTVPGGSQQWVQMERLSIEPGWRPVIATHKHWNVTGYGESDWSGPDRTEARKGTIVERTDESQPGVWKRLVPRKDGGSYKEENFDHPLGRQRSPSNNSSAPPSATEVDLLNQATGVPSLGAESVNFAPGAR